MNADLVILVPYTLEQARQMFEDLPAAERAQVSSEWLAELATARNADPWRHGFAVILSATGERIGTAGFKGPPDAAGMVEIAYGIDEAHRGRGHATAAARALIAWACAHASPRIVRAHTLPEANASTRVLKKLAFIQTAEVVDPDDGPLWRWELILGTTPAI